jgi:hypothetical protein
MAWSMIQLPFTTPFRLSPAVWFVCPTTIYRFLPSAFVDAFFADGSLRLSSFQRFHQHEDEQRLDQRDGKTSFAIHIYNGTDRGHTLTGTFSHADEPNAFILCASTRDDLGAAFGCDSYIRIDDPTAFGQAVARRIPHVAAGTEGFCIYQDRKIIERMVGQMNAEDLLSNVAGGENSSGSTESINRNPLIGDPTLESERKLINPASGGASVEINAQGKRVIRQALGHVPFFLKDKSFADQSEYRLGWMVSQPRPVPPYIDIKVPEAIRFCSKPNSDPWLKLTPAELVKRQG